MHVNRRCNSWRQKCDQERSREDFKIYRPHNRNSNKIDTRGATGTISKSFGQYLSNITGKHKIKELQKTPILDTARILRELLL